MLKVIVEMHPFEDSEKKEVIEEFTIANLGTGDSEHGDYRASFWGGDSTVYIKKYPRRKDCLQLIKIAIEKLYHLGDNK